MRFSCAVHGGVHECKNEDRPLRPRSGEDPEVGKSREQLLADDDKEKAPEGHSGKMEARSGERA